MQHPVNVHLRDGRHTHWWNTLPAKHENDCLQRGRDSNLSYTAPESVFIYYLFMARIWSFSRVSAVPHLLFAERQWEAEHPPTNMSRLILRLRSYRKNDTVWSHSACEALAGHFIAELRIEPRIDSSKEVSYLCNILTDLEIFTQSGHFCGTGNSVINIYNLLIKDYSQSHKWPVLLAYHSHFKEYYNLDPNPPNIFYNLIWPTGVFSNRNWKPLNFTKFAKVSHQWPNEYWLDSIT